MGDCHVQFCEKFWGKFHLLTRYKGEDMKEFNKIYVLSDIHGYVEGLIEADKVVTKNKPLYLIGDLFDHQFGFETQIMDTVLKLIEERRCHFIVGNHDQLFEMMLIRTKYENKFVYDTLTASKNKRKYELLIDLFDYSFYVQYLDLIEQLSTQVLSIENSLSEFYSKLETITNKDYKDKMGKVTKLFNSARRDDSIRVNGTSIFMSHSGESEDLASRGTCKDYFKLDDKYDYGIMGHLTIPKVRSMIEEEGDMIDYKYFVDSYKLVDLKLVGNYSYNKAKRMILVDDGSYTNLVEIR